MDPRRKIEEKYDRIQRGRVPFLESYRETVLEPQSLGGPLERELIVLRIDKAKLQLYAGIAAFVILLLVVGAFTA